MQNITNVDQVGEEKREMTSIDAPEMRAEGGVPLMGGADALPDHGSVGAPIGSVDLFHTGLNAAPPPSNLDPGDETEVGAVPALGI